MRTAPFLMSAWPGLTQLWLRGEMVSLAAAVAFGGALQLALVVTFVWPQLLSAELPVWAAPIASWIFVVGFWLLGLRQSLLLRQELLRAAKGDPMAVEPLLRRAQVEYLKGNWIEGESLLKQLLSERPADAEGQLLLATLYRRTKRYAEASKQLDQLLQSPTAARWVEEIEQELRRLKQVATSNAPPMFGLTVRAKAA